MARRLAAILVSDVVGYSSLMREDEAGTLAALKQHRSEIFDPAIAKRNGRIVKLMGDGALVEFQSVVDAVEAALSIQRLNADAQSAIQLRIGVNLGDIVVEGDDIFGDGVNVAARLEGLAEPNGICIASIVRESLGNKIDAKFTDAGEHAIKGVSDPVRVYRWQPESKISAPRPAVQRIRYCRSEDGHALAFALSGEGPPVLRFGPPMTTDLEVEWAYGLYRSCLSSASVSTSYLRFDSLGSGQSERVDKIRDFAQQARDAAAIADAAGFDRFAGVSFSGGCLSAIHFAALYPERLSRLVIVGGYAEGRSRRAADAPPDALKGMITEGWARQGNAFNTAFATSYFPEGPQAAAEHVLREMQAACPPEMMIKDRDAINDASVLHLLEKVGCPTLIIHSRDDAIHPLSQAQKLAAGIAGAELVVMGSVAQIP